MVVETLRVGELVKESLRPGLSRINRIEVDRDRTIGFIGEEGRVYGTPYLVRDIEMTFGSSFSNTPMPGKTQSAPMFQSSILLRLCLA